MSNRKSQAASKAAQKAPKVMAESDLEVDNILIKASHGAATGTPPKAIKPKAQKTRRVNNPINTHSVDLGASKDVAIPLAGGARLLKPGVEVIDGPRALKKADEVAFMNETIEIVISESDNPNAENPVPVSVNGRGGFIFRGEQTLVRRCYVERLARAKTDNFKQNLNEVDPEKFNILKMMRGLKYPFTVTQDKNPRGRDWLIKVLREA
jgi:hypothetical protein